MKQIIICLMVVLMASVAFADELVNEGFEGTFPPTGWTVEGTHGGYTSYYDYSWNQAYAYYHSGGYSALAYGTYDYAPQDELLYTGAIDLSGYSAASVTFWSYGFESSYAATGTVTTLEVSTDAKATWTTLWTYPAYIGTWEEQMVDISAYAGETVNLGWRHVFTDGGGETANDFFLDDVVVDAMADDDDDDATDDDDDATDDDDDATDDDDDATGDDDTTDDDEEDDDDDDSGSCCG